MNIKFQDEFSLAVYSLAKNLLKNIYKNNRLNVNTYLGMLRD
jgi:hypothetical protein